MWTESETMWQVRWRQQTTPTSWPRWFPQRTEQETDWYPALLQKQGQAERVKMQRVTTDLTLTHPLLHSSFSSYPHQQLQQH